MLVGDNISFTTDNRDYTIHFSKNNTFFNDNDTDIPRYKFNIKFFNNLGILLKEIILSEIDIDVLLDNFYFHLETDQDIMISKSINSIETISAYIFLEQSNSPLNPFCTNKSEIFRLTSYNGDIMSTILQFDMSDKFPVIISILENLLSDEKEINIVDNITSL